MRTLGLQKAKEFHDENKSFPYNKFILKEDSAAKENSGTKKGTAIIRVIAVAEPDLDGKDNPISVEDGGRPAIISLQVHKVFKKFDRTRCASDSYEKDPANCPLCRAGVPRTMETYIPVILYEKDGEKLANPALQIIEAGREALQNWIGLVEEMPGADLTRMAIKIKRLGKDTDTKYPLYLVQGTDHPLNDFELEQQKLIPNMEEIIGIKTPSELEKLAVDWERSAGAKKVGAEDETDSISF